MNIYAQLVGLIGVCLIVTAWQFNSRRKILFFQLLSALTWSVHFFMLGAYTATGINAILAARNYLFEHKRSKPWPFILIVVLLVSAAIFTWTSSSILALSGSLIGTIALWQRNPRNIRILCVPMALCWMTYNIINGSYAGVIGDSVNLIAILIGVTRFDIIRPNSLEEEND